jgi:hypothetical protein
MSSPLLFLSVEGMGEVEALRSVGFYLNAIWNQSSDEQFKKKGCTLIWGGGKGIGLFTLLMHK